VYPYKSIIKGIYLFYRPFWNAQIHQLSPSTVSAQLTQAGQLIKSLLPGIPLIFIEAFSMVNEGMYIPAVFDWIGMDCYGSFDYCGDNTYGRKSIPQYYQILKNRITTLNLKNKKLIVIPGAAISKRMAEISITDRILLVDTFRKTMNWIANEPDVIASLSFLYDYNQTDQRITGAKYISQSTDIHKLFWRKFRRVLANPILPKLTCSGRGDLNSYSMSASIKVSNYDSGLRGHYFFTGHDVTRNEWYFYALGRWVLYDGNPLNVISVPFNSLSNLLNLTLFTNSNLTTYPIGQIYLGYGVGVSRIDAFNNMIANPSQLKNCQVLPHN
jgi:hypothetical protein